MNRFFLIFLTISSVVFSGQILAADFEGHTEFTHIDLEGTYRVSCFGSGGSKTAYHRCRGYFLKPHSFAYFNHDSGVDADKVELSTVNRKGKTVKKTSRWDSEEGKSKSSINLWVSTLFQRPLLQMGVNEVSFSLKSGRQTVESGKFNVLVNDGGLRSCRDRSKTTGDTNLCENYSYACDQYFDLENDCDYQ